MSTNKPHNPWWGINAHFLNICILITNTILGTFNTKKYDKRRLLPFRFQQLVCFKSNKLVQQAYNIVLSQTLPILYTTNLTQQALSKIQTMVNIFVENGFQSPQLYKMILNFCSTEFFHGLRFSIEDFGTMLHGLAFNLGQLGHSPILEWFYNVLVIFETLNTLGLPVICMDIYGYL